MEVSVNGILTDQFGKVLLRRIDKTTVGLVGHPLEPGVLPDDTLARAYRETTGLIVRPVRLTGLYYDSSDTPGQLALLYRCIMRGGTLSTEGEPAAGFFHPRELPAGLEPTARRQLDDALAHTGGTPALVQLPDSRLAAKSRGRLRRLLGGRTAPDDKLPVWVVAVKLVLEDGAGRVGWLGAMAGEELSLPAVLAAADETPWAAAERLRLSIWPGIVDQSIDLRAIELADERPQITFAFYSRLPEADAVVALSERFRFHQPDPAAGLIAPNDAATAQAAMAAADTPIVRLAA